ncbi:MAG: sigma-54-dependent Fis family transcriptional regulator [Deltaproteobacteria bacterium]|nr:sigma-54-dependent Fis family transcriptional regulator [Deltaproteobacteria bacterium]
MDLTFDQLPPDKGHGTTVLIVDDEESGRETLRSAVSEVEGAEGVNVLAASSISEAAEIISSTRVHVVLLDKNLGPDESDPCQNGLTFIPEIIQMQPHAQILMVTASQNIQDAVTAIKYGAFGFVCKGCDPELLILQIEKAIAVADMAIENICEERRKQRRSEADGVAGKSRVIKEVMNQAKAFAESNRPVVLLGETGVGKTTIARLIHEHRKKYLKEEKRPFFSINIAALSEELAERELFGNERGAFTDAKELKPGFFELSNNGTLFLDEIGDASPDLQVKLLKVIDEGKFFRLGGSKEIYSKFKLICATHKNLEQMVADGTFREDLYYRISTFKLRVPSLAERKEDIPDIIEASLPKWCQDNNVYITAKDIPEDFIEFLKNTPIKGNIRGVEQYIARLLVLSPRDRDGKPILKNWKTTLELQGKRANETRPRRDVITLDELETLPLDVVGPGFPGLEVFVALMTEHVYADAARKIEGSNAIARELKISPATASIRLRRYQLTKPPKRSHAETVTSPGV